MTEGTVSFKCYSFRGLVAELNIGAPASKPAPRSIPQTRLCGVVSPGHLRCHGQSVTIAWRRGEANAPQKMSGIF